MRIIAIFLLFISLALHAKEIDLNLNSTFRSREIPEKNISTTVRAILGKTFKLPLESTPDIFLQVNASEFSSFPDSKDVPKEILFKIQLLKIVNGKEKIIASPEIITVLGKNATITQESDDKVQFLEIDILPTKIIEKI
jgi:hypothetical protein